MLNTAEMSLFRARIFRRGVASACAILWGGFLAAFGIVLLLPGNTFALAVTYEVLAQIFPEDVWGRVFSVGGSLLVGSGFSIWWRLRYPNGLTFALVLFVSLPLIALMCVVVSAFALSIPLSGSMVLFSLVLIALLILAVSAIDELNIFGGLARAFRRR